MFLVRTEDRRKISPSVDGAGEEMAKGLGIFMDCYHLGSSPSDGSLGGEIKMRINIYLINQATNVYLIL